jgi:hypothetical protein
MSVKMLPVTCKSDGKDKELSCNLLIFEPFESCKKNRGYQIENSQSITTSQFCIEYGKSWILQEGGSFCLYYLNNS